MREEAGLSIAFKERIKPTMHKSFAFNKAVGFATTKTRGTLGKMQYCALVFLPFHFRLTHAQPTQ